MSLYIKKARDKELCLALRKKAKESLKANATAEAVIVLDAEVPATQQQLRDLIQREASKIADAKYSALHNELAELKKSMNSRNSKNTGRGLEKNKKGASQKRKMETKPSAMPTVQENEAQQGQKPTIVQETKATDGLQSQAEAITAKTTAVTANLNRHSSTKTEAEEQKVKDKMGKTTMAKMDDVALVPDQGTGAEVETEGEIPPPPGRPRDRGRLRICIRLQFIRQTSRLTRTCIHANDVHLI
jgi:myosin heavy subunit